MTRFILALLVCCLIGVAVTLVFTANNGYVLIRQGDTVFQTSLAFFTFLMIIVLIVAAIVWRILAVGWRLPERMQGALHSWRGMRAGRSFRRGLVRLFEGRWNIAEAELTRRTWNPKTRMVNYLAAARAAHMQGAFERRDHYIALADACRPGSDEAVLLTQSELLLEQAQYARALPVLERLHKLSPNHPYVLERLMLTLHHLRDWPRLKELLPTAEALGLGDSPRFGELQVQVHVAQLEAASEQGDQALTSAWHSVPRKLRQNSDLVGCYARCLGTFPDREEDALQLLRNALKNDWRPELLQIYGDLESSKPVSQLAAVEEWLNKYSDPPELLLLAGRLCLRSRLWGKAQTYLDKALKNCQDPDYRLRILQAQAQLAEQTSDTQAALNAYRQGLEEAI